MVERRQQRFMSGHDEDGRLDGGSSKRAKRPPDLWEAKVEEAKVEEAKDEGSWKNITVSFFTSDRHCT